MPGYSLTYIYHDCFMLETARAVVIFDYWKDPLTEGGDKDFPPLLDEITDGKKLYVVVSHHHKDHFSRRIFLWSRRFPEIKYIVSADVRKAVSYLLREDGHYEGYKPPKGSVDVLSPGESYFDGIIKVKAYPSTDIGNSYMIEIDGNTVFHAGDLNAWLWLEESTKEEIEEAKKAFAEVVDAIAEEYPCIDLAMFPLDSRLGLGYWIGAGYFVETIKTRLFVPMHFELVLAEEDKTRRRIDAGEFHLFARRDFGSYLQLASSRSRFITSGET